MFFCTYFSNRVFLFSLNLSREAAPSVIHPIIIYVYCSLFVKVSAKFIKRRIRFWYTSQPWAFPLLILLLYRFSAWMRMWVGTTYYSDFHYIEFVTAPHTLLNGGKILLHFVEIAQQVTLGRALTHTRNRWRIETAILSAYQFQQRLCLSDCQSCRLLYKSTTHWLAQAPMCVPPERHEIRCCAR